MAVSLVVQHRTLIIAQCSWHEGKQIKALGQGPRYGRSLDEKISDVEHQSASLQRCIERLQREAIARTESNTEQAVHLASDIKAGTSELQADARKIKEDSAVSRTGIARMEANQASITAMIQKMHEDMEKLLQDNVRNKECKDPWSTYYPMFWLVACESQG